MGNTYTKTGNRTGTNEGGFYTDEDGRNFYIKFYADANQAYGEDLANMIYWALGYKVPNSSVQIVNGKTAFVSEIVEGTERLRVNRSNAKEICKGFVIDAFLANYDVIGLEFDNILEKDGYLYRIDNGSAFLHRAMGKLKEEDGLNALNEFESMFTRSSYATILALAGYTNWKEIPNAKQQVEKILGLRRSYNGWEAIKDFYPKWDKVERVIEMLEARTQILVGL